MSSTAHSNRRNHGRRTKPRIPSAAHVDPTNADDPVWVDCDSPALAKIERNAKENRSPTVENVPTKTFSGKEGLLQNCQRLVEEDDEGSVEYKWRLVGISANRLQHLVTQMKFRVGEGCGECIYELGVEDDGFARGLNSADFAESLDTIDTMAKQLDFVAEVVHVRVTCKAPLLRCAEIRVRKVCKTKKTARVAVLGELSAGKSTLVGTLVTGSKDDGKGTVRQLVFNHKHELLSGQTSSIAARALGFGEDGHIVNYDEEEGAAATRTADGGGLQQKYSLDRMELTEEAVADHSASLAVLLDLPGHAKRQHTVLSALVGRFPNIAFVIIDASSKDVAGQNRVHFDQLCALNLPFIVVLTKHELVSPVKLSNVVAEVDKLVRQCADRGTSFLTSISSVETAMRGAPVATGMKRICSSDLFMSDFGSEMGTPTSNSLHGEFPATPDVSPSKAGFPSTTIPNATNPIEQWLSKTVPIISTSSVTGHGIDLLRHVLREISTKPPEPPALMTDASSCEEDTPARLLVHSVHQVKDVGYVLGGTVASGSIKPGQNLCWGPWPHKGKILFCPVTVQSIHVQRVNVRDVSAGTDAAFAIGTHLPSCVDLSVSKRKGTVLWAPNANGTTDGLPSTTNAFRVMVKSSAGVLSVKGWKVGRELLVYAGNIRQTASVKGIYGATEDATSCEVELRFCNNKAELLWKEASVVLVDPNAHATPVGGCVCALTPHTQSSLSTPTGDPPAALQASPDQSNDGEAKSSSPLVRFGTGSSSESLDSPTTKSPTTPTGSDGGDSTGK